MSDILDSINNTLNNMQQEAVFHDKGPLLILAGAGSGKTRVLTHRIAYLIEECGVSPYSIMALTFTNKAAGEMKERVERIVGPGSESIWVSTFHSTCVRILRRFIDTIGYERDFTIYDSDDQKTLMKDVCKYLGIDTKNIKEKAILSVISHCKDELITPEEFEKDAGSDPSSKKYAACYKEYQKRLKQNNALDFDDLIVKTIELFHANEGALEYYRNRFRYIMVDEYQDTNSAQFALIHLLAHYTNEYGEVEKNLCVVGDDDQSIYKFRGANIRNILDFEKSYPSAKVIRLEQNYRSTKNILNVANEVIHNNRGRKDKTLWTANEDGSTVSFNCYENDIEEATMVINSIWSEVREGNYEYKDYAILYRTNAQSRSFEETLLKRNIPYRIIGGQNFYQRREIKDMLAYLRVIDSGRDSVAAKRIINVPKRGIGLTTIDRISEYSDINEISFYESLRRAPFIDGLARSVSKIDSFVALIEGLKNKLESGLELRELIDEILEETGYIDYLGEDEEPEKVEERVSNINELISKIALYEESCEETNEIPTLSAFLDEVSLVADIDNYSEDNNMVVLMTIHSAKGLEFPNVFLVGMEEGLFPGFMSINADNPAEEIEEERRLCYVGMTRAKENLILTAAKIRMMRGETMRNRPSRFINEIPRYLIKQTGTVSKRRLDEDDLPYEIRKREQKVGEYMRNAGIPKSKASFGNDYPGFGKKWEMPGTKASVATFLEPATSNAGIDYAVGDRVKHVKFGEGTVMALVKGGKDYEVTVEFEAGVKKMLASFAKLQKV